ncbi:putative quinol monooxygenase [Aeromonas media]|uniref:putative quinol monooxygenase n=1 Tax=Aeromonas media TaxID=651 RepID=UPI0024C1E4B0|nr:putative quinol monooxygenase [Aeromonas media]MDM5075505.1 antibiotic biosynthesis monooxygenase [Aeromonas media]
MSSPITVIAELEAKPEFTAECRTALSPLIAATLQEPGCLCYQLHQSLESPHGWMIHEEWESEAALSTHQQQPHFLGFVASTRDWFASTNVRRYQLA